MTSRRTSFIAAAAIAAATLSASPLASAQSHQGGMHGAQAPGSGSKDMMSAMQEGNQKMMSMPMTGDPDVDFAMMMRMHHMAGIRMAEIELRDGKDSKTKQMAKKIIASQKKDNKEFEAFLARHGHPAAK